MMGERIFGFYGGSNIWHSPVVNSTLIPVQLFWLGWLHRDSLRIGINSQMTEIK